MWSKAGHTKPRDAWWNTWLQLERCWTARTREKQGKCHHADEGTGDADVSFKVTDGLFHSALFDKTPPKSTKKLSSCTGDHSLPASFLLLPPPISFSTDQTCTQAETLKTGHFSLFTLSLPQPVTVRTLIPTFTPSRDVSTMVQQAHRPSPYEGEQWCPSQIPKSVTSKSV